MLVLLQPLRRRAREYGESYSRARQDQYATVEQFLGAMKVVKAGNAEANYVSRLSLGLDDLFARTIKFTQTNSFANAVFQFSTAITVAAFVAVAIQLVHMGRGLMIVQLLLFLRLGPRMMGLQQQIQDVLINLGSFTSMRRLEVDATTQAEVLKSTGPALRLQEEIRLENVSFTYPMSDHAALDNVTAMIRRAARRL